MAEPCCSSISCTTFNILAPIYKRLDHQNQSLRESDCRAFWVSRNRGILDWLLYERSSIICLQEFWVGNEELVHMYQKRLGDAGYITFQLARTNNRGDGLLTAVRRDYFRVLNYRELLFNDFGDRVAQLFHVQLPVPLPQNGKGNAQLRQEILIVNTHLLFPHDSSLSIARLRQVYKILQFVESYQKENKLKPIPIILCGDWNGSKRGHVYKFLRSQGFVSSYDATHQYTDSDADAYRWVSHRNHRGNICGVDFIWLLNPNKFRKPLKTSWAEAAFGIIRHALQLVSWDSEKKEIIMEQYKVWITFMDSQDLSPRGQPEGLAYTMPGSFGSLVMKREKDAGFQYLGHEILRKASLAENDAFALFKADNPGDFITRSSFCEALCQVNLIGHPYGLSLQETEDLWIQADNDGNGFIDYEKFQRWIWNPTCSEQREEYHGESREGAKEDSEQQVIGFKVKNAVLSPREVEKGIWPENYSLSDHARLTVVFSAVRMLCPVFKT